MNELLKRVTETVTSMLKTMTTAQKFGLFILIVGLIGTLVWVSTPQKSGDMARIIGPDEDITVRAQVKAKLDEKNIRYVIQDQGVYVPRADAERIILDLASEGIFGDEQIFKFLKESDLTATRWQQEKKWQIALQRRIELMLKSHEAIKDAKLQLTPPSEAKTLGFPGQDGSAAVWLTLKPNKSINSKQLNGIVQIVAAGSGLKPSTVRVMDKQGKFYRMPKDDEDWSSAQDKRQMEEEHVQWLENQVKKALQDFGEVYVAAYVRLSSVSSKEKLHEKNPDGVELKREDKKRTEKSTTDGGVGGIKGEPDLKSTSGTTSEIEEKDNKVTSDFGYKFIETNKPAGEVLAQSLSVVLPVAFDAKQPNLDLVKKRVATATGTKDQDITVDIFQLAKPAEITAQAAAFDISELVEKYGGTAFLGIISLIAIFVMYKIIKLSLARQVAPKLPVGKQPVEVTVPEVSLPQFQVSPEYQAIKSGIQEMVNKNPRVVAGILRKWVFE